MAERILARFAKLRQINPPALVERLGIGDESPTRDVRSEMVELGIRKFPAQIVARATWRLDADVAGVRDRSRFDQLPLLWAAFASAGDGP